MRTTIRLDDGVLLEAKRHAAETHRTLTRVIQDALVALLQRERGADSPRKIRLPVFQGDGVFDGVDINNTASLIDRMELDR
jgi:hypothetical protein